MELRHVFSQILILFILLVVGFVARKARIIEQAAVKGLTSLAIKVTLPGLIIDSMVHQSFSPRVLANSGIILAISFGMYLVLTLASFPFAKLILSPKDDAGVYRFCIVFSNVGFMGYPVVEAVFGKSAIFYTTIFNLPFNFLVFTFGILILVFGRKTETARVKFKQYFNPAVVSILIGFVLFLFQVKLPEAVGGSLALLGSITSPLSMLVIGALLANSSPKTMFANWRLYLISFMRLAVIPLGLLLCLRHLVDDRLIIGISVIIAGMPVAANTALLAEEYDANPNLASEAVFLSTLLSVGSIPLLALALSQV